MSKIKLVFIGCGGMAGAHLSGYIELKRRGLDIFDIVAVADPVESNTANFAKRIAEVQSSPQVVQYKDYEKMLQEQKPDAADICTPHYLHHVNAIYCFETGVDAIVEKPLGVTVMAGKKMVESAKQNGRILAVAEQVRRWMGPRTVAWAVHSGLIGEPTMFFAQTTGGSKRDPDNLICERGLSWRSYKLTGGGGPIFDFGVHYIDLLIYLFGDIESVYAHTPRISQAKYRDANGNLVMPSVEDTSIATMKFKNGMIGTWNWTGAAPGKSLSYTVYYGSRGSIYSDGVYPDGPQLQLWDNTIKNTQEFVGQFLSSVDQATINKYFPPELIPNPAELKGDYGVMLEVYDFLCAIRDNRRPELDGWDGLKAQVIPIAFFESSTLGQAVKIDDVFSEKVDMYQREINEKWQI
ncbi:Gfo/Idh/MocA family oxidoreductase [Candidatus Poribacteria bacterium]|nr:Gfo/Idh/MocA family oxidoreductase [Candidatus Poribacteria bacterium]